MAAYEHLANPGQRPRAARAARARGARAARARAARAARAGVLAIRVACAALLAASAGCGAPTPRAAAPVQAAPPPVAVTLDPSYDWHVLLIAPFGSVLKDVPLALHEVLLFRDATNVATDPEAECYAADAAGPRFFAATPDEYVLCFSHDRLSHIQVKVRVAGSGVPGVFAAACAGWMKTAATAGAGQTAGTGQTDDSCEGRDSTAHFSAHLEADAPATVSVALDRVADPGSLSEQ